MMKTDLLKAYLKPLLRDEENRRSSNYPRTIGRRSRLLIAGSVAVIISLTNIVVLHWNLPDASSNIINPRMKLGKRRRLMAGLNESYVLQRMLRNMQQCKTRCTHNGEIPNQKLRRASSLTSFGLIDDIEQYERGIYFNRTVGETTASCVAPKESSTDTISASYSIAIVSDAGDVRVLFINCLALLHGSSASQILILIPETLRNKFQNDESYGRRLLAWNEQPDHPVSLHFVTNVWNGLRWIQEESDAVSLVYDHSSLHQKARFFDTGVAAWQQRSVATFVLGPSSLTVHGSCDTELLIAHSPPSSKPFIFDQSYLCFLQQTVFAKVQSINLTWKESLLLIRLLLTLLSGEQLHFFMENYNETEDSHNLDVATQPSHLFRGVIQYIGASFSTC